jgi:V8-like Glu-specific endopeptidase
MQKMKLIVSLALLALLNACGGGAGTPDQSGGQTGGQTGSQTTGKPITLTDQTGVARYHGQSDCTAFVLDLRNDAAPAYALTNGHCAQNFSDPDTPYAVWRNRAATSDRLVFFYAANTQSAQKTVQVSEITYSSMNQTDLAVLKLKATVGQLRAQGIEPIQIHSSPLASGSPIQVIGAPSGEFLRQMDCKQGPRVDVTEFVWVWSQLQSNDCAQIYPGMSGSPVFDPVSRKAVGVINTTTVGMSETHNCYLGSPCEISAQVTRPRAQTSYAVPIDGLAACFVQGQWAPQAGVCPLPLASGPALLPQELFSPMQHPSSRRRWQLEGPSSAATQVKFITAGLDRCNTDTGYQTYQANQLPFLPTQEGVHLACVREGRRLTVHPIEVDNSAPTASPIVDVAPLDGAARRVTLSFKPPEISGYDTAISATEAGCRALPDSAYTPYFRVPLVLDAPVNLCVKVSDRAGNKGRVWAQAIP